MHFSVALRALNLDKVQPGRNLARRRELERAAHRNPRVLDGDVSARPVRVGHNAWIGFDSCILPGVTIGDGAIVGARSVVGEDVEPYTVVAGNPARVVKRLEPQNGDHVG